MPRMQIVGAVLLGLFLSSGDDLRQRYGRCEELMRKDGDPQQAIEACRPVAEEGVPGAQLALAIALLRDPKTQPEAVRWLQRAAQNGHPMAAYLLALMPGNPRKREWTAVAHCAGLPQAEQLLQKTGIKAADIDCTRHHRAPIDGAWSGSLGLVKSSPAGAEPLQLRVVLAGDSAKVFLRGEEVKPGKFRVARHDETVIVSATDVDWDLDGKWIESWALHLLPLSPDEVFVSYVRTVNNPHVPSTMSWRAFTTVAEGTLRKEK